MRRVPTRLDPSQLARQPCVLEGWHVGHSIRQAGAALVERIRRENEDNRVKNRASADSPRRCLCSIPNLERARGQAALSPGPDTQCLPRRSSCIWCQATFSCPPWSVLGERPLIPARMVAFAYTAFALGANAPLRLMAEAAKPACSRSGACRGSTWDIVPPPNLASPARDTVYQKSKGHHGHPGAIAGRIPHSNPNKTMLGVGINRPSIARALPGAFFPSRVGFVRVWARVCPAESRGAKLPALFRPQRCGVDHIGDDCPPILRLSERMPARLGR